MVGHSLRDDFEHLKLNENEYACEIRDISEISFFKRSKNCDHKMSNAPLSLCNQDSCGSGSPTKDCHNASRYNPFASEKRKLKELADEFLNAKIQ